MKQLLERQLKEESMKTFALQILRLTTIESFKKISAKFHGVELYKTKDGRGVKLPDNLLEGHDAQQRH
jgi:hypothetical protein